jgi:hypothetical protein
MPTPSPCGTIRERRESECDHLPTSDSSLRADRNGAAIPDLERIDSLECEPHWSDFGRIGPLHVGQIFIGLGIPIFNHNVPEE